MLIMHGDKDPLVPISQSEELAAALKKAGVEVTFQVVKGNGHGGPDFLNPENRKLILDFFDKHLRNEVVARPSANPKSAATLECGDLSPLFSQSSASGGRAVLEPKSPWRLLPAARRKRREVAALPRP